MEAVTQLEMFPGGPVRTAFPPRFAAFRQFHRDNPEVYRLFRKFARQALDAGMPSCGARLIGERIRWHVRIETQSDDGFKVNDHHWPYYSRLLMLEEPRAFDGFFERRDGQFDVTDEVLLDECGK